MHLSLSITQGCGAHSDANLPVCNVTRKRYAADQKRDTTGLPSAGSWGRAPAGRTRACRSGP